MSRVATTALLLASPELAAASYTPTRAQWDDLLRRAGGELAWVVKGRQTDAPATGPYTGCGQRLVLPGAGLPAIWLTDQVGEGEHATATDSGPRFLPTLQARRSRLRHRHAGDVHRQGRRRSDRLGAL